MLAATDRECRARDEIRIIGDEEEHRACNVVGSSQPANRKIGDDLFRDVLGHRAHHVGIHVTRCDSVHSDSLFCSFERKRLSKTVDA